MSSQARGGARRSSAPASSNARPRRRGPLARLAVLLATVGLLAGAVGSAVAVSIQTDLWIYADGDTVTVTGVDFVGDETVDLVTTDPEGTVVDSGSATADASGAFVYAFVLRATFGGIYDIVAVGRESGLMATTQFDPPPPPQDNVAPTIDSSFPANGGAYPAAAWAAGCTVAGFCGTASDTAQPGSTVSGVDSIEVAVKRVATGKWWKVTGAGADFDGNVAQWFDASGSTTWSYAFPFANFASTPGLYLLSIRASDGRNNQSTTDATFRIQVPTVATVTVATKTYDGSASATITGCTLSPSSGDVTCQYGAASASFADASAGTAKAVTATGLTLGGTDAPNYVFSGSGSGTGTILKAPISVDAVAASKVYGTADPTFAAELRGFVNGEDAGSAGVSGAASCTRLPGGDVGTYTITCAPGTLDATNYSFTTGTTALLTILPATATATIAGPEAVRVTAPGSGASGLVTWTVGLAATSGDITTATVGLVLDPVDGGTQLLASCGTPSGTGSTGSTTCTRTGIPLGTYEVRVTVGGNYVGATYTTLTVYDATIGAVAGGGRFEVTTGVFASVGFSIRYNRSGTNLQGSLVAVIHHLDGTVSRLRTNARGSLAVGTSGGYATASFNGRATWTAWDTLAGAYVTTGNVAFAVWAKDGDRTASDEVRLIGPVSMTGPAPLAAGNLVIPRSR